MDPVARLLDLTEAVAQAGRATDKMIAICGRSDHTGYVAQASALCCMCEWHNDPDERHPSLWRWAYTGRTNPAQIGRVYTFASEDQAATFARFSGFGGVEFHPFGTLPDDLRSLGQTPAPTITQVRELRDARSAEVERLIAQR